MSRLTWLRRIGLDLPRSLELSYCLLRDPRVPARNKLALGAALGFAVSPLDLPAWVPVVGGADVLVLTLLATSAFVDTAPDEVVAEHRRLLQQRRSTFDVDVAAGRRVASSLARLVRRDRGAVDLTGVPVHRDGAADPLDTVQTGEQW